MITALGEILIDYTPKGNSEQGMKLFEQNAGGAPANVLCCASKLGVDTAFIGKVGNDMQGHFLKKTIEDEGIVTSNLIIDDNFFTTLAFVSLSETGERSFAFARKPGADTQLKVEEIDEELIEKTSIFHFGSLSLTDEPSRTATIHAVSLAKQKGKLISYDPNYRAPLWSSEQEAINKMRMPIELVDIMKISDEETVLMTDEMDPVKAGEILLKQGVSIVVVTLGDKGSIVMNKDGNRFAQGFKPSCVADTTGAGDCFWGAFLYQIHEWQNGINELDLDTLEHFAMYANAAASLCVENFGAIKSMPTQAQVYSRINER